MKHLLLMSAFAHEQEDGVCVFLARSLCRMGQLQILSEQGLQASCLAQWAELEGKLALVLRISSVLRCFLRIMSSLRINL